MPRLHPMPWGWIRRTPLSPPPPQRKRACPDLSCMAPPTPKHKTEPPTPQGLAIGRAERRFRYDDVGAPCESADAELPPYFLEPLSPQKCIPLNAFLFAAPPQPAPPRDAGMLSPPPSQAARDAPRGGRVCRQFWKAGEYEERARGLVHPADGMDHVRVHPKFLHSNATSHKWALGAMAELLDNTLDEVAHGATFVNMDVIENPQTSSPMLIIEDDGGGMTPDSIRRCMSLGYSRKSRDANVIGQYGNGFKTSTMRLGADVIVFSCANAHDSCCTTKSIGMLSYTFLCESGQQDIIVPMVDYEVRDHSLQRCVRSSVEDWNQNMETIRQWSPYATEAELLSHFKEIKSHGTKIIIYNLWEDDEGQLELDFDADPSDIQLRGTNRDEKKILLAKQNPNSMHYFTYRYSLRSYASILYMQLPKHFRIILRRKEVCHHSLVKDLMLTQILTYKPHHGLVKEQKENAQLLATVTIGFVKDAKKHIDIQGFNVYHKNRLIKPFWKIWNTGSSTGRGIIGVLEANFIEPAHDKQGFEHTNVLARLEARLLRMQKSYWFENCHKIGYSNWRFKERLRCVSNEQSLPHDGNVNDASEMLRRRPKEEGCFPSSVTVTGLVQSRKRRPSCQGQLSVASISEEIVDQGSEAIRISDFGQANDKDKVKHSSPICRSSGQVAGPLNNNSIGGNTSAGMTGTERNPKHPCVASSLGNLNVIQEWTVLEIDRRKKLEARVVQLRHEAAALHNSILRVTNERDNTRNLLEEEHRQGASEDGEIRKKLKEALMRVRDLEVQNYMLRSAYS